MKYTINQDYRHLEKIEKGKPVYKTLKIKEISLIPNKEKEKTSNYKIILEDGSIVDFTE